MSTQYRLVQSGKTASGGWPAGQGSWAVAPRIKILDRTPLDEWSARRKGFYLHGATQHINTKTNIHASSEIGTHDPSNQAAKTYAVDRAVIGICALYLYRLEMIVVWMARPFGWIRTYLLYVSVITAVMRFSCFFLNLFKQLVVYYFKIGHDYLFLFIVHNHLTIQRYNTSN
jgi:hypothetical protein